MHDKRTLLSALQTPSLLGTGPFILIYSIHPTNSIVHVLIIIIIFKIKNWRTTRSVLSLIHKPLDLRAGHHRHLSALNTRCLTLSFVFGSLGCSRCRGTADLLWLVSSRSPWVTIVFIGGLVVLSIESGLDAFDFANQDRIFFQIAGGEQL